MQAIAEEVGISVPPDICNYDSNRFPHWTILEAFPTLENAKIITNLSMEEALTATFDDLEKLGIK